MLNWFDKFKNGIINRVRGDAWLYAAIAAYTIAGILLMAVTGHGELAAYGSYLRQWTGAFVLLMPLVAITFDLAFVRLRYARRQRLAALHVFSAQRIAYLFSGVLLMMSLVLFQGTFTSIKNLMPVLRGGFLYDQFQADIDRWLWLGHQPWKMLYALAGHPFTLAVVEWNYNVLWFVLCFSTLFFVATSPKAEHVRTRYFFMFMLVWFLCGNVLAGIFISAGPAFYAGVTGDAARFAEQHSFLSGSSTANSAATYQDYLWALHERGLTGFGSGISAFPSVHVGLVAMNAFFAAELSRKLGIAAFAYTAFVALSSVYLGWHYSIDGYVSILVVGLLHVSLRRLMRPRSRPSRKERWAAVTGGVLETSA